MSEEWIETNGVRPDLPDGILLAAIRQSSGECDWGGIPCRADLMCWVTISAYKIATPAKAEREPSGTTWFSKPAPRWVRCDDRLPGDGRVYQARERVGKTGGWNIRLHAGDIECKGPVSPEWEHCYVVDELEWLDEAPAQEGQEVQRESAASSRKQMPEQSGQRQSDSHPYPAGTLTRAMRQRAAESEDGMRGHARVEASGVPAWARLGRHNDGPTNVRPEKYESRAESEARRLRERGNEIRKLAALIGRGGTYL